MFKQIAAILLCLFSLTSQAEGILKVGIATDCEPLAFKEDGELKGIKVDNARAVGRYLNRQVRFIEMPLAEFIPALQIGKIDVVMSGFSITEERAKSVLFTEPFLRIGQMAIIRTADAVDLSHPSALFRDGLRIAVQPDTTGQAFATQHFPKALIQTFEDDHAAFRALRNNVTDVYIHDSPTSWLMMRSKDNHDLFSLARPMTEEGLAWAVAPTSAWLLRELNQILSQMRITGELQEIQQRWIPTTK